jgi:type IV secretory pathway VirJ component
MACTGGPAARAEIRGAPLQVDTLRYGPFGPVVLYRAREHPSRVVLFVSGDGGWNQGVVRMAEALADRDALVVGIDIRRYLGGASNDCTYPAGDLEALSQWLQHRLGYPVYIPPLLAGYSSGAALVYLALAQAPPSTFLGALSLGFCLHLPGRRSYCRGPALGPPSLGDERGRRLAPLHSLAAPWIELHGESDSSCTYAQAEAFVRGVANARIVRLPGVGHGFGVESRWMPQLGAAFDQLTRPAMNTAAAAAPAVRDLPVVELRSRAGSPELAVVISGDGGWAGIDRQIGQTFAADGIPVVGLNSLQYFWKPKTPDQAANDLGRLLRHYLQAWGASRVLLVGYSRGADVLPFMLTRLPPELQRRVSLVALVGPAHRASFEFHFSDLLTGGESGGRPTVPEIRRLQGFRLLCIYGDDETDSACPDLPPELARRVALPGGHHFGGAYLEIARRILEAARAG